MSAGARWALGALCLLGFGLRVRGLASLGLWYDEVALWEYALTGEVPTFSEAPLMAWLLYPVMWLLGSADPVLVHLVPVLLGSLTVPFAYWVAARVGGGAGAGLLAAALVAISPMAIHYSREGRPYALFILLSGGVYAAFIHADGSNGWGAWSAYGLLLALCALSHLLGLEVVLALGLYSLAVLLGWRRPAESAGERGARFVRFAVATALGGVAGSLWSFQRIGFGRAFEGLYPGGPLAFLRVALIDLGPGPVQPHVGRLAAPLPELLSLGFLALFALGLRGLCNRGRRDLALLFALAVAVPLLVKYTTLGERKAGWDWARWITHALLPYLVVAGAGADWLRRRARPPAAAFALGLLALGVLPAASEPYRRDDYRDSQAIAGYLERNAAQLKGVLILPVDWRLPGPADDRITDIYYLLKREQLPTYHFADGRLFKVGLVPSRGNLTLLPRRGGPAEALPASGRYAVLSRRWLDRCGDLAMWFRQAKVTATASEPISRGLTVCALEFGG